MASKGILGAASIPFIGCVTLLLAMILHILSFASPFWAEDKDEDFDFGLWRSYRCIPDQDPGSLAEEGCYRWNHHWDVADWLNAVRALESLAVIFWAIPLVILPVYIYVALGLYYRCLLGTMTAFTLLGVGCSIAGVIVFGVEIGDNSGLSVSWCLPVCAAGAGLGLIAFIIFLVSTCKRPKFKHERHFVSGFYVDPDRNRMYVVENVEQVPSTPRNGVTISPGQVNPAVVGEY
ncbi:hypothetical protein PoB_006110700 [Plakobranchus ocellatus]|uniref:Uncharacterized protein n=1 Tax=Plakobranchus ocellatus TaxID=259542 RepID=A0AAV4CRT3_9GAST|nr:hypothetical protein PoB_006110700 [Plakobranchus ocellatus]